MGSPSIDYFSRPLPGNSRPLPGKLPPSSREISPRLLHHVTSSGNLRIIHEKLQALIFDGRGGHTCLKSIHEGTVGSLETFVDPPLCGQLTELLTTPRESIGYSPSHESRCGWVKVHLALLWLQREAMLAVRKFRSSLNLGNFEITPDDIKL